MVYQLVFSRAALRIFFLWLLESLWERPALLICFNISESLKIVHDVSDLCISTTYQPYPSHSNSVVLLPWTYLHLLCLFCQCLRPYSYHWSAASIIRAAIADVKVLSFINWSYLCWDGLLLMTKVGLIDGM